MVKVLDDERPLFSSVAVSTTSMMLDNLTAGEFNLN